MSLFSFDRYETVRIIFQSSATEVRLVRLKETDELFVAKRIDKRHTKLKDIYFEANLLQDIRHPAIPTLYDTIEEPDYFCLIEEYIAGDSLDHYLLYHQYISKETFLNFAIQLCDIIAYLHAHMPYPILYLDMKPAHVIVCENQIKLIDFGIAKFLSNSGTIIQKYGTKKYAAPEQIKMKALNQRTDVYGVGQILKYMEAYLKPEDKLLLHGVSFRATWKNQKFRTKSIEKIKEQLEKREKLIRKKRKNEKHLCKKIAIVGSDTGVGCTHFAIAFVSYLNQAGFYACYRNQTEQRVLEQIKKHTAAFVSEEHIIYHEKFRGLLRYHPQNETNTPYGIQVLDCGCQKGSEFADATIYVCGGRLWQNEQIPKWKMTEGDIVVCNFSSTYQAKRLARELERRVYVYPLQKNPFHLTMTNRFWFSRILTRELKIKKDMGKKMMPRNIRESVAEGGGNTERESYAIK